MQRKSLDLQLNLPDYLDVEWSSVKYYVKRQLSKCVNECKAQASHAKKLVGSIRSTKSKDSSSLSNSGASSHFDESDGWDTDFDDDYDDDEEITENKENTNASLESADKDEILEYNEQNEVKIQDDQESTEKSELNNNQNSLENDNNGNEKKIESSTTTSIGVNPSFGLFNNIPKPFSLDKSEKPSVPKPPAFKSNVSNYNRNGIPRPPPLKRPPNQPPPPPVAQSVSNSVQEPPEEYEIPILSSISNNKFSSVSSITPLVKCGFPPPVSETSELSSNFNSSSNNNAIDSQETYEIIEAPPEENYEVVDENKWSDSSELSKSSSIPDRPVLPPRSQGHQLRPPPPLPEKPAKLQELTPLSLSKRDSLETSNRHLLTKGLESKLNEISWDTASQNTSSSGSSPNLPGILKEPRRSSPLSCADTVSLGSANDSHSSRSSTPDRSDQSVSALSTEGRKVTPPPLPARSPMPEENIHIANRPLPPVPNQIKDDLTQYPWFHDIERDEAEKLVKALGQEGSYLVRPSKRAGEANPFTVTIFNEKRVFHLNIRLRPEGLFALGKEKLREKTFSSVADLIRYHQVEPILLTSRGEPAGNTSLCVYPCKEEI